MPYPRHLLPQIGFKTIGWRDGLRPFFLGRSAPTADFWDDETDQVRPKFVLDDSDSREQLKDYSTNLLGIFTESDAAVRLDKASPNFDFWCNDWRGEQATEQPSTADFQILTDFGCFFYPIGTVQGFPRPFSIANQLDYLAHCYVCHTPTNANFWHFSVRWKIGQADVADALTKSQRKNLLGLVRAFLVENALRELPADAPATVPEDWYKS